jgi:class 3 adenylate cyclase
MPIRAGLHSGEIEERGDDVGEIAVHVGARAMDAAGPGEILVSQTVRDLIAGSDITLEDRDTHELEGLVGGWRLYAVKSS